MKTALATLAALAAFAFSASPALGGWVSNGWQNPGGNIACYYFSRSSPMIQCTVRSSGWWVSLGTSGKPDKGHDYKPFPRQPYTLQYGQKWQSHQFTCLSMFQGVRCWNPSWMHSFFVNAWTVQTF
jgi:hypothetical protein